MGENWDLNNMWKYHLKPEGRPSYSHYFENELPICNGNIDFDVARFEETEANTHCKNCEYKLWLKNEKQIHQNIP